MLFGDFEKEDLVRVKEIIGKFSRYGFGEILLDFGVKKVPVFRKKHFVKPAPIRMRILMEDLGGAFVKFGQMLSSRKDLIPEDWVSQFELLQDKVKSFSYADVKGQVEKELNGSIDDIFSSFSRKSLASASIGQVHKAKLRSGEIVAVKIQRPSIERNILKDLHIMKIFLKIFEKAEFVQEHSLDLLFREFERSILRELDYDIEANNISMFYDNFKEDKMIKIPKVYDNYSTKKILVMEFIVGKKISEVFGFRKTKINKRKIAAIGVDSFFKQIFEFGLVHGDPHPGNIYIYKNSTVCFLDFGNCLHITKNNRRVILKLLSSIVNRDVEGIVSFIREISLNFDFDENELSRDIQDMFDIYFVDELGGIKFGDFLMDLTRMTFRHKLRVSLEYISLMKILIYVENIGVRLDPTLDIVSISKPYVEKFVAREYKPKAVFDRFNKIAKDNYSFLEKFPSQVNAVFNKIKSGKIDIEIGGKEIDELEHRISDTGNRVTIGLVLAALIVSSTLTLNMGFARIVFGMPVVSFIGFLLSGFLGAWLLLAFVRSKF